MFKTLTSTLAALALTASAVLAEMPEKLRFAVTDLNGMEELQREFGPFRDILQDILDTEIEFYAVPDRGAATAAIAANRVDIVLAGPSEYVLMRSRADVTPVVGIEKPGYYAVIASPASKGIDSLEDLDGKKVITFAPGGTSTELTTCLMLEEAGFDCKASGGVDFSIIGGFAPLIEALVREEVDAVGFAAIHYRLAQERAGYSPERFWKDFPIIAETPRLPPDLFVARAGLSEDVIAEVRAALLANEDAIFESIIKAAGDTSFSRAFAEASFTVIDDATYDYIRKAYAAAGYDNIAEID
ncbi:MAG: PhnD/SsuA/transferrin family substrate-binding protein [Pseudomonadota bacterium]